MWRYYPGSECVFVEVAGDFGALHICTQCMHSVPPVCPFGVQWDEAPPSPMSFLTCNVKSTTTLSFCMWATCNPQLAGIDCSPHQPWLRGHTDARTRPARQASMQIGIRRYAIMRGNWGSREAWGMCCIFRHLSTLVLVMLAQVLDHSCLQLWLCPQTRCGHCYSCGCAPTQMW